MYIFKNTGTMVIGVSQGLQKREDHQPLHMTIPTAQTTVPNHEFQIVASDTTVFQDYTRDYYNIQDRQIIKLSLHDKIEEHKLQASTEEKVNVKLLPGFSHFYTMEMHDEPECVDKALHYGARLMGGKAMVRLGGLEKHEEKLMKVESLILAACGTSHYACKYVEGLLKRLGCFNYVECKIASEITREDLIFKNPETACMISVSQSGETMDLLIPFRLAKEMGLTRINVVNKVNSTLARENDCGVFINCGRELSVASTKAYTA